jgi:hypothetical protein
MVECNLPKVEVAGSSPVSRSVSRASTTDWKSHPHAARRRHEPETSLRKSLGVDGLEERAEQA